MTINWKDKAVQDRLLTAFIASIDNKVSVKEIARLYGGSMTYHAVENYLRKFRVDAVAMKEEAKGRKVAAASVPRPRRLKTESPSPSPSKAAVKTGRVGKTKPTTPKVKTENVEKHIDLFDGTEVKSMYFGKGIADDVSGFEDMDYEEV